MKQLQKSDLKLGEIYWFVGSTIKFLNKISSINIDEYDCYLYNTTYFAGKGENLKNPVNILEATPEEKHWLETCIKENKFISYEEAMKSFIPEYYEYIGETNLYDTDFIKGKTYKIVNKNDLEAPFNFINEKGVPNGCAGTNWKRFKPSTKEAYDAQFVVKEPKVVLEEPKDKVLTLSSNYGKESIVKVECSEGGVYRIGDKITVFDKYSPNKGKPFTIKSFRWSNDKSKICAVTELHTPNGISLDKIELYVEPKVKVKDDFVLPEKWCVEVNEELRNRFGYYEAYGYHHSIQISDINKWSENIKEGFTEITFEQFKKYVLKNE